MSAQSDSESGSGSECGSEIGSEIGSESGSANGSESGSVCGTESGSVSGSESGSASGLSVAEGKKEKPGDSYWTRTFMGMLLHPGVTIELLSHDNEESTRKKALYSALIMVLLAYSLCGAFDSTDPSPYPSLSAMFAGAFNGCICWLALSSMLYIISGWFARRDLSFSSTLICVGWSFLPLIFVAPCSCFHVLGPLCQLVLAIPFLWTLILQWIAFTHCLSISMSKLFAMVLVGTPILFLAYLFWLSFAVAGILQVLLS